MIWIVCTCLIYAFALWLFRRSGHHLLCLPVITGTALLVLAMALTHTDYPVYAEATRVLRWLAGPAIIALAVPLYRQAALLRRLAGPLLLALLAGCLVSVLGTLAVAWLLGTPAAIGLSIAPKAATMPMAMMAAERAGGVPALAALSVMATGVLGILMAGSVMRLARIRSEAAHSFALGLVSHAIGLARALQAHPGSAAFAALAMGLNGVLTALVVALLSHWIG